MFNKIVIIGHLGTAPEEKKTKGATMRSEPRVSTATAISIATVSTSLSACAPLYG